MSEGPSGFYGDAPAGTGSGSTDSGDDDSGGSSRDDDDDGGSSSRRRDDDNGSSSTSGPSGYYGDAPAADENQQSTDSDPMGGSGSSSSGSSGGSTSEPSNPGPSGAYGDAPAAGPDGQSTDSDAAGGSSGGSTSESEPSNPGPSGAYGDAPAAGADGRSTDSDPVSGRSGSSEPQRRAPDPMDRDSGRTERGQTDAEVAESQQTQTQGPSGFYGDAAAGQGTDGMERGPQGAYGDAEAGQPPEQSTPGPAGAYGDAAAGRGTDGMERGPQGAYGDAEAGQRGDGPRLEGPPGAYGDAAGGDDFRDERQQYAREVSDRTGEQYSAQDVDIIRTENGRVQLSLRDARIEDAREQFREEAAEEFDTPEDNVVITEDDGELTARPDMTEDQRFLSNLAGDGRGAAVALLPTALAGGALTRAGDVELPFDLPTLDGGNTTRGSNIGASGARDITDNTSSALELPSDLPTLDGGNTTRGSNIGVSGARDITDNTSSALELPSDLPTLDGGNTTRGSNIGASGARDVAEDSTGGGSDMPAPTLPSLTPRRASNIGDVGGARDVAGNTSATGGVLDRVNLPNTETGSNIGTPGDARDITTNMSDTSLLELSPGFVDGGRAGSAINDFVTTPLNALGESGAESAGARPRSSNVGASGARDITTDTNDTSLLELDLGGYGGGGSNSRNSNLEAAVGIGAAGVVTPEPTTSIGGAVVAGGAGLALLGSAALDRRSEIESPEDPEPVTTELDVGGRVVSSEIDTPSRRTTPGEIDVGDGELTSTEIDTPAQPRRTGEVDVPVAEATGVGGRVTERVEEEDDELEDVDILEPEDRTGELAREQYAQSRYEVEERFGDEVYDRVPNRDPFDTPGPFNDAGNAGISGVGEPETAGQQDEYFGERFQRLIEEDDFTQVRRDPVRFPGDGSDPVGDAPRTQLRYESEVSSPANSQLERTQSAQEAGVRPLPFSGVDNSRSESRLSSQLTTEADTRTDARTQSPLDTDLRSGFEAPTDTPTESRSRTELQNELGLDSGTRSRTELQTELGLDSGTRYRREERLDLTGQSGGGESLLGSFLGEGDVVEQELINPFTTDR